MGGWGNPFFDHVLTSLRFVEKQHKSRLAEPRNHPETFVDFGDCLRDLVKLSAGFCRVCPKNDVGGSGQIWARSRKKKHQTDI